LWCEYEKRTEIPDPKDSWEPLCDLHPDDPLCIASADMDVDDVEDYLDNKGNWQPPGATEFCMQFPDDNRCKK
jgi:hypothetical protein